MFKEEIQKRSIQALVCFKLEDDAVSEIENQIHLAASDGEVEVVAQVSDEYQKYVTYLVRLFKLRGFTIQARIPDSGRRVVNNSYAQELFISWEN